MAMGLEQMRCKCKEKGPGHEGDHSLCPLGCQCIKCDICGWIREIFWRNHLKLCPGIVQGQAPDSLDIAIDIWADDIGFDMAEELELSGFRVAVRGALEELLEHHEWFKGAFNAPREEKWRYLIAVIFDKKASDDEIVAKLVSFYPRERRDDELEIKIWAILAERDELFPANTPRS